MALGYSIAAILKRSSHVFSNERVAVKIDWLEQLNRHYIQVQGKDRVFVKYAAEQLGLEGSYIPRTYIEQIQLEKLVNEVTALPDDLKTKLSIDDEVVSSPREALSRASADIAMRNKNLKSGLSHSYSNRGDKDLANLTRLTVGARRWEGRNNDSPAVNQGVITQLSEQMSTLNERMDEFTRLVEELNSKLSLQSPSASKQNLQHQGEVCNGSASTSLFVSNLGNGTLKSNPSSNQLNKDSPLHEEFMVISRSQWQMSNQLDKLSNLVRDNFSQKSKHEKGDRGRRILDFDSVGKSLIVLFAVGGVGLFLFKRLSTT